jgi:hypothetical protein
MNNQRRSMILRKPFARHHPLNSARRSLGGAEATYGIEIQFHPL